VTKNLNHIISTATVKQGTDYWHKPKQQSLTNGNSSSTVGRTATSNTQRRKQLKYMGINSFVRCIINFTRSLHHMIWRHTHIHNRFTAVLGFVRDYPGNPAPER